MQIFNMENFSKRCADARKSLGFRQIDLAKMLDIKQTDISYIETGKAKRINISHIHFLLSNGISWRWLFEGKGSMSTIIYPNSEKLNMLNEPDNQYSKNK